MASAPESYLSDRIEGFVLEALHNIVNDAKRGLIDFVELQEANVISTDPKIAAYLDKFRKRVHNEVASIEWKMRSVITVAKLGGEIPRFGRSDEERQAAAEARKVS
jgi:hypothetical protein